MRESILNLSASPCPATKLMNVCICRYTQAWEGRKRDDSNASGHETARTPESCRVEGQNATGQSDCSTVPLPDDNNPEAQYAKRASLPCIYYATRTHSQIGQVRTEQRNMLVSGITSGNI